MVSLHVLRHDRDITVKDVPPYIQYHDTPLHVRELCARATHQVRLIRTVSVWTSSRTVGCRGTADMADRTHGITTNQSEGFDFLIKDFQE